MDMDKNLNVCSDTPVVPWVRILLICLVIVALWAGWTIWLFPILVPDIPKRGLLGDSFGMINALFSGLAFAGVVGTVYLQIKELKLQRQELRDTRKEIKGQKDQLVLQNNTLTRQNFESSFFQLFNLYNNTVDTMKITSHNSFKNEGRKSFLLMHRALNILKTFKSDPPWATPPQRLQDEIMAIQGMDNLVLKATRRLDITKQIILEEIRKRNEEFLRNYQGEVGHYFRHLNVMLNVVDKDHSLTQQQKNYYISIIRAHISVDELAVLYYYCLSEQEKNFKRLIEDSTLFENLDFTLLIPNDYYEKLYETFKRQYCDNAYGV